MKRGDYVWLVDVETGVATRVQVKRIWRWRGPKGMRRERYVLPGHVTRMVVGYCGTVRRFNLWRDSDRFRFIEGVEKPEGFR